MNQLEYARQEAINEGRAVGRAEDLAGGPTQGASSWKPSTRTRSTLPHKRLEEAATSWFPQKR